MTTKQAFSPSPRDDDVDLRALLGTLLDHKWLILLVTGAFLVAGVLYAMFATPIYQASALVQVEPRVNSLPGMEELNQTLGTSASQAVTEIALLTSRTVIGQAVDDLKLDIDTAPKRFPVIGGFLARHYQPDRQGVVAAAPLGLSGYDWGGAKLGVYQMDVPKAMLDQPMTLIAGEHGNYILENTDGDVLLSGSVGELASAHGIQMQVRTLAANPGTRFNVVRHSHLATVNRLQTAITATEQGKDSGIIELDYRDTDAVLAGQLLDRVAAHYVRQNVERNSAEAASSLAFVQEQLPNVRLELEKAQMAMNAFQTQAQSVDITMQTQSLLDQVVTIDNNIQQLRMQQADVARHFTPQHPAYQTLMKQIGSLEGQKATIQKQVGSLPDTQQELLKLTRDVQVSNQTYTSLLNQAQQLNIARAGTVGNVRVIDHAAVAMKPWWPKQLVIIVGAAVLGLLLALAWIFTRQLLKRGIEDPAAIEQIGLPVYASIPVSEAERKGSVHGKRRQGRQHLLALTAPADLATEALRSLRTSLHFARLQAKNNVLMISSASPGAGKTFVGANLAAVIAQSGSRVLLIDADMRKGALHAAVGGGPARGLSELIAGQLTLAEALRPVQGVEHLSFIARGKTPPNPSELLMHANFTALLQKLMPRFDLIIIDTPPVLAVTDAAIIGHHVGTSLLVVRFGVNVPRQVALARQRLELGGVAVKGAIFNGVERRNVGYYAEAYHEYASTNV